MATKTTAPPVRLLTDSQAAEYLGVSRSYVRSLVARGALRRAALPATLRDRPGRMLRLDIRDLDALIEKAKAS
ncbi:MAG: helix-turn-helix domain-containing protein [Acidobacteriota bacterium]|nr:helix-turn-helix domain-containing protein [Acidobacteriota bacterium]